ncbi:MAG: hypothetical protein LRY40_06385 [Shewanella fodinae]|nr:hypothetical protein [Shewanella fodinae]
MASSYLKAYWLAAYSKLFLALAVAAAVIYPVISETETTSSDHAAIIDIAGTIGGNADSENGMKIGKNILAAIRDEGAKAIILMANSPGGAPADSQIVYDLIDDYRKSAPLPPNLMTSINNAISDQNLKFMSDDRIREVPRRHD